MRWLWTSLIIGDPSTAGTQWHHLFHKLLGTVHRGTFKDCLALFFVSQFYCVNKVPSPLSFHYFSACAAYCIDFGLNRYVHSYNLD